MRNNQRGRWVWVDAVVGGRGQDNRYPSSDHRYHDRPYHHPYQPGHSSYPDHPYHRDWPPAEPYDKGKGYQAPPKGKGNEPCDDDGKGKGQPIGAPGGPPPGALGGPPPGGPPGPMPPMAGPMGPMPGQAGPGM